jgi:hypothetical protein
VILLASTPPVQGAAASRLQDRSRHQLPAVAGGSILEFGADPTGSRGSSSAINAALAARAVVYAPCGTYRLDATIRLATGKSLRGAGACTVFAVPPRGFSGERVITNSDLVRGNRDISISDFALRVPVEPPLVGGHPGIIRFEKVDGLTIERIRTDRVSTSLDVIHLAGGVRHARIHGCRLRNDHPGRGGGALGIYGGARVDASYSSRDIVVSGNTLQGSHDEAVAVYGWFNTVANVLITGNTLVNRGATEVAVGIMGSDRGQGGVVHDITVKNNTVVGKTNVLTGARRVRIVSNRITGPSAGGEDAIFVAPARGTPPREITLADNVIEGAARHGVYANATAVTLTRNTIRSTHGHGIFGGTTIEGNTVVGPGGVAIFLTPATVLVRENRVVGGRTGIASSGLGSAVEISENTITDASIDGILLDAAGKPARDVRLSGNSVVSSPEVATVNGIKARNGTFEGCVALGNTIRGASSDYEVGPGWTVRPAPVAASP